MHNGYVKLWRKSLHDGWLSNHKLWVLWSWCLLSATHKDRDIIVGNSRVHLSPGDFIFGRDALAAELGMSVQSVRTLLIFLKNQKNITIKSTSNFSVGSIVNWDSYQQEISRPNQQINQQANQQLTSNQPATNQQLTTNKNVRMKECKKKPLGEPEFILPDWIPKDSWEGFIQMRAEKKKPLSARARDMAIKELARLRYCGEDVGKVLDQSTFYQWAGLFKIKKEELNAGNNTAKFRGDRVTGAAGSQRSDDPEIEAIKERAKQRAIEKGLRAAAG